MKYYFADLVREDDRYGIKKALGEENLPLKLSNDFDITYPQVWGNIIKGEKTSGIYGEIISSIRRWGYKEAKNRFILKTKNRFLRYFEEPDE